METYQNGTKIIFQRQDRLWPISESTLLNNEEFERLVALSDCNWAIVKYPSSMPENWIGQHSPDTVLIDYSGLKTETLEAIQDKRQLSDEDIEDLLKNTKK